MAAYSGQTSVAKISVTKSCLTRLREGVGHVDGWVFLIGSTDANTAFINGFYTPSGKSITQLIESAKDATSMLAGGLSILGFCRIAEKLNHTEELKKFLQHTFTSNLLLHELIGCENALARGGKSKVGDDDVAQSPVLIITISSDAPSNPATSDLSVHLYCGDDLISPLEVDIDSKSGSLSSSSKQIVFKVNAELEVGFQQRDKPELKKEEIEAELTRVKQKLRSSAPVYRLSNTDILLFNRPARDWPKGSVGANIPASQLVDLSEDKKPGDSAQRRLEQQRNEVRVIDVQMLLLSTGVSERNGCAPTCAPIIHHTHDTFRYIRMKQPIDVLVCVPACTNTADLPHLFTAAICRQVDAIMNCLLQHGKAEDYYIPRAYHFQPESLEHTITVVYPDSIEDIQLVSVRKSLHDSFSLPLSEPMFRRQNSLLLKSRSVSGSDCPGYLTNVHVGLGPSGVVDGGLHIVRGRYNYHHYMQDRLNDDGWGCAYRSLQTVVSWLHLQGYISQSVPTHNQIQQALVDVGDKEKSFVGSKKWIGSTELSYVLDHLYNISSKILHVSSGAEMADKARDLAHHFDTQRSPVMIGGGVLAHTILGIDWNEQSGDVKFLILDPHYTGAEDIKVIQDKGWCGWKGPDFWDKNAYYNMCMPQVPAVF